MINDTFEILNLQQRKIQTPLFRNAKQAFKPATSNQKYHAKYLVIDSTQHLPQKIFMENNICPVFIYSNKSYIFQEGLSLYEYFLSKKDTDIVLCQEQLWKLIEQITKALILLREAGYEHKHIKEYAIRRVNADNYKLVFHPSIVTPQQHIEQRNYNWYNFCLAPQQLSDFSHEQATTCVFSLGCMILNLMNPLDFRRDIYSRSEYCINYRVVDEKIQNGSRLYSKKIVEIVKNMLVYEHQHRITLYQLLSLIHKYSPFGKKVEMASSLKSLVSSKMAKSKQKINSPPKQSHIEHKHQPSNKRSQKQRLPVINFQRGTFGGHRQDSSTQKQQKQRQQNETLLTKQSLINSRARQLQHKDQAKLQQQAKRSYSQYFEQGKVKKWNKKQQSAKHSLASREVQEIKQGENELRVTQEKGKIKVDININQSPNSPIGYNQYIIQAADKKKIRVGLTRQESDNDKREDQQAPANKPTYIPHSTTKQNQDQSMHQSHVIQQSVNLFKSRLDNYNLKLAQCLQQPLAIAKKLGYQGVWINGNVYYGEFKNGRRNGLALQIFQNKEYYYGHYRDDMFHGEGFYYWNAHQHFLGVFEAGCKKEGTWWGKNKYTGEIKDNMRHGIGSYFYSNGKIYQGQWFMGKRHGSGIIIQPSGQKFIGTFKMANKWGHGTYLLQGCRVIGVWDGQQSVDKVEIIYQNGRLYKGYINDYFQMHGKGQLKFTNGSICRGNFQNGDFVYGEMVYQNGQRYVGEIKDFRRHGRGTYSYNDGRQVTAEWLNNKNVGVIKD